MGEVPSKLGRYEIVKHLANGGMAQVLIARATGIEGFERHVVVKRINGEHKADPAFVQMFLDEARTAAALHHTNIVQVHDIGKDNGEYFFAMEYVHGQDLRMLLKEASRRRDKVPWEHVVTIMTGAAAGLHHAHELRGSDRKLLGLVHRDVSPANILIGYDGTVKMVDFGIAKAALRGEGTKGGALKGKAAYMAPEQCCGKPIDRRSDVYALGVVLYELSTVRRLFKGPNDFLTMSAIVAGNIPPPASVRPDIPPQLVAIIMKALSMKPENRYQTADEMREALEAFANELQLRTSTGALASYMKYMFGAQPEPWLVQEDAELELTVDFDGSASGILSTEGVEPSLEVPAGVESAPIERARRRITDAPPIAELASIGTGSIARRATPPPIPKVAEGSQGIAPIVEKIDDSPPTMTVDLPRLDDEPARARAVSEHLVNKPNRTRVIASVLAAIVLAIILVIAVKGSRTDESKPRVEQATVPPEPVKLEPPKLEPPTQAPVVAPPDAAIEPVVVQPAVPAVKKPPPPRKRPPPKKWNPDELFLPGKKK